MTIASRISSSSQVTPSMSSITRRFDMPRLERLLLLPGVTFRHDVDVSLRAAVRMAAMQQRLGVRSTFYVMARSPYYRVQDSESRACIAAIRSCGHEIGLHVDLGVPRGSVVSLDAVLSVIEEDHARLAVAGPRVSFHCPPECVLWTDVPGWESAYAKEWEGRYVSDSRGVFAYGDPEDREDRPLVVNLHPEWWFGGMPDDTSGWFWR